MNSELVPDYNTGSLTNCDEVELLEVKNQTGKVSLFECASQLERKTTVKKTIVPQTNSTTDEFIVENMIQFKIIAKKNTQKSRSNCQVKNSSHYRI